MCKLCGQGPLQEKIELKRLCQDHDIDLNAEAKRQFGADFLTLPFNKTRALTDQFLPDIIREKKRWIMRGRHIHIGKMSLAAMFFVAAEAS